MSNAEELFDTVIVRFAGEIGIKAAWTRKLYERRLTKNIKAVFKHHAIPQQDIFRRFGRLFIRTSSALNTAKKLNQIFGISSLSPALETSSNLNEILDKCVILAGLKLQNGNSFAIKCRRVGEHKYTSQSICQEAGRRIFDAYPQLDLHVNLKHPDVALGIEVREDKAFVYTDVIEGPGGLPLGTQQRVVCLFKGDLRSSIACWMAMKRGCPPILLYFDDGQFVEETNQQDALCVAKGLLEWAIGFPRKLHVISNSQNHSEIMQKCPEELASLLRMRLMLRIASQTAKSMRAEGIITGDVLNEAQSQTVQAFRMEDGSSGDIPVHRPILGFDAEEIEEIAQKIPALKVTGRILEKSPASKKTAICEMEEIIKIEKSLKFDELVKRSVEETRTIDL